MTLGKRIKLCIEILTLRSGHKHHAQVKQLSTFSEGYHAGLHDAKLMRLHEEKYSDFTVAGEGEK